MQSTSCRPISFEEYEVNGRTWYYYDTDETWLSAQDACQSIGKSLPTVQDLQNNILSFSNIYNQRVWSREQPWTCTAYYVSNWGNVINVYQNLSSRAAILCYGGSGVSDEPYTRVTYTLTAPETTVFETTQQGTTAAQETTSGEEMATSVLETTSAVETTEFY